MILRQQLLQLSARQHGAVALRQARQLGATYEQVRGLRQSPTWLSATSRVLVLAGAPPSELQRLMIAVLDAGDGAVASHRAAAALWELPGFDLVSLDISRERHIRHPASTLGTLHLPSLLPADHVTERLGIPVTSVARTIYDLAAEIPARRLARLVDTVLTRSPSTLLRLHELVDTLGRSGRDGTTAMRAVLEARPPGHVPAASGLEARFLEILADAGEPAPRRQVDVGGHEWIGRVDFVDGPPRLLIEIDSRLHHTSISDVENDHRRDEALAAAGFLGVLRIRGDDVWRRPDEVVRSVRRARAQVRAIEQGRASALLRRNLGVDPPVLT